jgi:hypothetical protein
MTNKILNVLEEIKKLRVENANKSNIVIHPTRFANNIDKVANTTRAYTEKIYGSKPDHFSSHTSNYKDSIRSVEHLSQFKHSPDVSHSTYFSNFYGIPKIKEMSNNENTLYYEKQLGKQTEFDYAINIMGSEMDKEAGLRHIINTIQSKKSTPINVALVTEKAKAAKEDHTEKKAAVTAAAVKVQLAFERQETFQTLSRKLVHNKNMKVMADKKYHMDYDKERSERNESNIYENLQETLTPKQLNKLRKKEEREKELATSTLGVTTRSQSLPSTKTPRTPLK